MNTEKLPRVIKEMYDFIQVQLNGAVPKVIVLCGSSVDSILTPDESMLNLAYKEIPNCPGAGLNGDQGRLEVGKFKGKTVAVMHGRAHIYAGYTSNDTVRLLRVLTLTGARHAVITCAAGGTSTRMEPGSIMLIRDHLNFSGFSPLDSEEARALGQVYVDMNNAYDQGLASMTRKLAHENEIKLFDGIHAWMCGPQYETATEVRALKTLGVDTVGMSTVHEVIALRQLGVSVLGLATVMQYGTGVVEGRILSHSETEAIRTKTSSTVDKLIRAAIDNIH